MIISQSTSYFQRQSGSRTGASSGTKSETSSSSSSLKESSKRESILSGGLLGRYQWYFTARRSKRYQSERLYLGRYEGEMSR